MSLHLFLDTETTGLLENSLIPLERQPHVIELFMLLCDASGKELGTWHSLFKPPQPISAEITRITSITNEMLVNAPSFSSLQEQIRQFIDQADVIVAHNLTYDLTMLENEFLRAGQPLQVEGKELLCTVEATEHVKGYRLNLTSLHEHLFGCKFEGAHRAESDVRATAKCFFEALSKGII